MTKFAIGTNAGGYNGNFGRNEEKEMDPGRSGVQAIATWAKAAFTLNCRDIPLRSNFHYLHRTPPHHMKLISLLAASLFFAGLPAILGAAEGGGISAEERAEGWVALTDGQSFTGWKMAEENQGTWKVEDGAFVAHGARCHLFYAGDSKPFKNFILRVEVQTEPHSNGGIYFHTKYQATGWPRGGFEVQVNNSHSDWIRTASIYGIANTGLSAAHDNEWWTQEIAVEGQKVSVKVGGKLVLQYVEPAGVEAGKEFERKLGKGTFALQGHDPKSVVRYRNIRVKRLD